MSPPPPLSDAVAVQPADFAVLTEAWDPRTVVVGVSGEVDLVTAAELEAELKKAVHAGAGCVIVDLTAVEFFDSSAIHALVVGGARLQAAGADVRVVCSAATIRRVLAITCVDRVFPVHATVEEAATAGSEPGGLAQPNGRVDSRPASPTP